MNPLKTVCLLMGIFALASANRNGRNMNTNSGRNSIKNSLKPTDWLSVSQLESLPAVNEVSFKNLEEMSLTEGADLVHTLYHLSHINHAVKPDFTPSPSDIPAYIVTPQNEKVSVKLNRLVAEAQNQPQFGEQELTVYITGLNSKYDAVKKAERQLVNAYMQRYNGQRQRSLNIQYDNASPTASEEEVLSARSSNPKKSSGTLVVIKVGDAIDSFKNYVTLDTEKVGAKIGEILVELLDKTNVPQEVVHVIGSNAGANIAGAAGREYTRITGHQLRRITGLDPARSFAKKSHTLGGLARGDAQFVDAIHSAAESLGHDTRSADVDFYPNGPSQGPANADNIMEAAMLATQYYSESVLPGNERNFPAVSATSLEQYKKNTGNGQRAFMGIDTDTDVEGDYVLQVNNKRPFGRSAVAKRQQNYHNVHQPWKSANQDYE